ncbi:MAG: hypothetical protein IJ770_00200 [Alphaproteobacteria bacterium]|nr:hypothetical protein [Alphaproteobacteria bacterium]
MKKILIGIILLLAVLLIGLSTSATFLGEGLVGYLVIELIAVGALAYWLPKLFAPKNPKVAYLVEVILGICGIISFAWFGISTGLNNSMLQRIGSWLLLNSLFLLGIGAAYSFLPWFLNLSADSEIRVSEQETEPVKNDGLLGENATGWCDIV